MLYSSLSIATSMPKNCINQQMQYNQIVVCFSVAKKSPHHENALPGITPSATTCNTRHRE